MPCTRVGTWPGAGTAFFTPLGHGADDVVTVRSDRIVAASDGGPRTDQLLLELRLVPGMAVTYPRTVTLGASTEGACRECVTVGRDLMGGTAAQRFFVATGTLFISRADDAAMGRVEMMGGGPLQLVEWSATDSAVAGGGCYTIDQVTFTLDYSQGPITGQGDM